MDKLLVVFVVLGGYVEVAELKYQHNKVRGAKMALSILRRLSWDGIFVQMKVIPCFRDN